MKTIESTLTWHTWPVKPVQGDLPIAIYIPGFMPGDRITTREEVLPAWLTDIPLKNGPAYWARLCAPDVENKVVELPDPLAKWPQAMATREAIIAASNAVDGEHARRLFNETFLKEVVQ